jgi:hypothetical protein
MKSPYLIAAALPALQQGSAAPRELSASEQATA